MGRRIYLSRFDKKVGGVCGGIAEYFRVDSTLIRLLWIVISIFMLRVIGGVFIYILAWILFPRNRE